jgi:hypothetical protein
MGERVRGLGGCDGNIWFLRLSSKRFAMNKNDSSVENKIFLSREEILDADEPQMTIQLPSGNSVQVKFLAYFLVQELLNNIDSDFEENKERRFSESVVGWLLCENNVQDLNAFSEGDQECLIEIAAKEWGCKDEYDEQSSELAPEGRFFQAAIESRDKFHSKISEHIKQITPKFSFPTNWFGDYYEGFRFALDKFRTKATVSNQMRDILIGFNAIDVTRFCKIGEMTLPISRLAEEMTAITNAIKQPYDDVLAASINEVLASYQSLMNDVIPIENFTGHPDVVRYLPTIEMYNTSVVTGQLYFTEADDEWDDEIITPDENELMAWLGSIDASFPMMLEGAKISANSQNPDHCRHFASSHRELCTHILHSLSPDEDVSEWTDDPNHFYEGRPTRRTRLLYIVRHYRNQPFVEFFLRDFLNQIDLLNADQHRRNQDYTESELLLLHERFLSDLGFLMEIVCGSNEAN